MMLLGIFGFWFFCGVISSVVASNKGRSVFGWFAIGLLLGPVGVVLSLVISKQFFPNLIFISYFTLFSHFSLPN